MASRGPYSRRPLSASALRMPVDLRSRSASVAVTQRDFAVSSGDPLSSAALRAVAERIEAGDPEAAWCLGRWAAQAVLGRKA